MGYLTPAQRRELLDTLGNLFPRHFVYCDLMRQSFFEGYGRDLHQGYCIWKFGR